MEDYKKKSVVDGDKEIVFSKAIKAGKRIYYLDVKKNRKDEMFLAITESKKIVSGEGDDSQVSFEKHKIFLYKEDFEKFMNSLLPKSKVLLNLITLKMKNRKRPKTLTSRLVRMKLK